MNLKLQNKLQRGIVLINKQAGRTSHDEVAIIKRALRDIGVDVKVGHSGTLDPKVTGLLIVGLGKGTRVLEYMLRSEKQYVGEIIFHKSVTRQQLNDAIQQFTGVIDQLPPVKSSVKREWREREVYGMEVLEFDEGGKKASLFCRVEKGTYIRKLFHDMGEHLGITAQMGDLHRTQVGPFSEQDGMITTDEFASQIRHINSWNPFTKKKLSKIIKPIEDAVQDIPKVFIKEDVKQYIASGTDLFIPGVERMDKEIEQGNLVAVFDGDTLVALGESQISYAELEKVTKGVAVRTTKVLI